MENGVKSEVFGTVVLINGHADTAESVCVDLNIEDLQNVQIVFESVKRSAWNDLHNDIDRVSIDDIEVAIGHCPGWKLVL